MYCYKSKRLKTHIRSFFCDYDSFSNATRKENYTFQIAKYNGEGKWCATSFLTGSSGFDSHPEFLLILIKIRGWATN